MGSRKNKRQRRISPVQQEQLALQHAYTHAVCARWHLLPLGVLTSDVGAVQSLCRAWHMEGVSLAAHALRTAPPGPRPHISYGHAHHGEVESMREGGHMAKVSPSHGRFAATEELLRQGLEAALGQQAAAAAGAAAGAAAAGLPPLQGLSLHVMQPGEGPQPIHADLPLRVYSDADAVERAERTTGLNQHATQSWSVLLYTHDGPSTQVQTFTAQQHDEVLSCEQAQWEMLRKEYFVKVAVAAGTMLVMRGDVYHCAPRNTLSYPRVVVYGLFSPQSMEDNPEQMQTVTWPTGLTGTVLLA
jgi:hypothetical protein